MTAHVCRCPATPAITEPSSAPVRCSCCGDPLVITCANACNPAPHGIAPRPIVSAPTLANRSFASKPCAYCQSPFMPTGPRAQICPRCRSKGIGLKDLEQRAAS